MSLEKFLLFKTISRLNNIEQQIEQQVGSGSKHSINYFVGGILAVGNNLGGFIAPTALTITAIKLSIKTAPTGANLIIDINKNGTTIYTTQANRPTIIAGSTSAIATSPNVISISDGDVITLDIDQIGSTAAGESLTVAIIYTEV